MNRIEALVEAMPGRLKAHWFLLAAALVVGTDLVVLWLPNGAAPRLLEAGLLGDLSLVVPGLYIACYWRRGKAAVMRAVALAALGFWAASKLLPESGQFLIPELWPLRYVALAVLFIIEVKVVLAVYRAAFGGASRQDMANRLQSQAGMPAWAARLAAAEAAFWHAAYRKAKALFQRNRR